MLLIELVCLLKSNLPAVMLSSCGLRHYLLPALPDLFSLQGLTTSLEVALGSAVAPLGCREGVGLVLWPRGWMAQELGAFLRGPTPN